MGRLNDDVDMNRKISAVFIDRDGVVNRYLRADYVKRTDEMHLVPGTAAAIRRLNDARIPVVVISNQQGVGKGVMSATDLEAVNDHMSRLINEESGGVLNGGFYCPHLLEDGCDCRKPLPGLFLRARDALGLDLAASIMVGDSPTDMKAALAAGVPVRALVLSGATRYYRCGRIIPEPDTVCRDLSAAVNWIMEEQK